MQGPKFHPTLCHLQLPARKSRPETESVTKRGEDMHLWTLFCLDVWDMKSLSTAAWKCVRGNVNKPCSIVNVWSATASRAANTNNGPIACQGYNADADMDWPLADSRTFSRFLEKLAVFSNPCLKVKPPLFVHQTKYSTYYTAPLHQPSGSSVERFY